MFEGAEYWVCEARKLDDTVDDNLEYCLWDVKDSQLRITLPDDWASTHVINTKYGTLSDHCCSHLTKVVNFDDVKLMHQLERMLEGQWGWSSSGAAPFNAYIVFDRLHNCSFLNALNATQYPERTCEWGVFLNNIYDNTTGIQIQTGNQPQLKLYLDDNW